MLLRLSLILSLATGVLGCGDDSTTPDGGRDASADLDGATDDAVAIDSGATDSGATDSGTPDSATDGGETDGATDASDAGPGPDAGPGNFVAVAGERCAPQSRIGLFSIRQTGSGKYIQGSLSDSPSPAIGEPEEMADGCAFYRANTAPCECADELVCTHDRSDCVSVPENVDIEVLVDTDAESFAATTTDEGNGPVVSESFDLAGDTFSIQVTGLGVSITTEATTIPPRIEVADALRGSYDAPESMSLSWTPDETDALIYSLTNINHHVRETTFTECAADASDGALTIPGSMLVPLAVSTGLEFQRVQTIRFAAAELPQGCVEFRFSTQ